MLFTTHSMRYTIHMNLERKGEEEIDYEPNIQGSVTHSKGKRRGKHRSHVKGAYRRHEFDLHGREGSGARHIPKDARRGS